MEQVTILEIPVNCNWLQGVEGQIDSSHVSNLHSSTLKTATPGTIAPSMQQTQKYFLADRGPKFDDRADQLRSARRRRPQRRRRRAVGARHRVPDAVLDVHPGPEDQDYLMIGQVPNDDTHTTQWYVLHNFTHPIDENSQGHGFQSMLEYDGASFGRIANAENLWTQDRDLIDRGHWSGLKNILHEDIAIAESQGEIADRSREYLGQSDAAITRSRRILIEAVRDQQNGKVPRCLGGDVSYFDLYGRQAAYPADDSWIEAVEKVRPHERVRA